MALGDYLIKELGLRWEDVAQAVSAYIYNNIAASHLDRDVRALLEAAAAATKPSDGWAASDLAQGVVPAVHYYAGEAAYSADAANVLAGAYVMISDGGDLSIYRKTGEGKALICSLFAGSGNRTKLEAVRDDLARLNAVNLMPVQDFSFTNYGVTYTGAGRRITLDGTANGRASSCYLVGSSSSSAMPPGMAADGSYSLSFTSDADCTLIVEQYAGSTRRTYNSYNPGADAVITLGSDITGIRVHLNVAANTAVDGSCEVTILDVRTNKQLTAAVESLEAGAEQAASELVRIGGRVDDLSDCGAENLVQIPATGKTSQGVTYTPSGRAIVCSGTAVNASSYVLIDSQSALPPGWAVGDTYALEFTVTYEAGSDDIVLAIDQFEGSTHHITNYTANAEASVTVAAGTTGIKCYLSVASGDSVDCVCSIRLLTAKTNQELETEIDALRADICDLRTVDDLTVERTSNLFDKRGITLGITHSGASAAKQAISGPIPISSNGISLRAFNIDGLKIRVALYSSGLLSSFTGFLGGSSGWKTSLDVQADEIYGYCRIEFVKDVAGSATLTADDIAALEIMIVNGLQKPTRFAPFLTARDIYSRVPYPKNCTTITVITNNSGLFSMGVWANPVSDTAVENYTNALRTLLPDIMFHQELRRNLSNDVDALEAIFRKYFPFVVSTGEGSVNFIASRYPFDYYGHPDDYATVDTLPSGRKYQKAYVNINGTTVCLFNFHLTSSPAATRVTELSRVLELVQAEEYVIFGGDFQHGLGIDGQPYQLEIDTIKNAGFNAVNGGDFGVVLTNGVAALDNIFSSKNIYLLNATSVIERVTAVNSDHTGMMGKFFVGAAALP